MASFSPQPATGLLARPTQSQQLQISRAFFDLEPRSDNLYFLKTYFNFYVEELELLQFGTSLSARQAADMAVKTHEDILYLVSSLSKLPNSTREQFRTHIRKEFPAATHRGLDRSIDLALRLCLMLNITQPQYQSLRHPTPCLVWGEGEPLQQRINNWFPGSRWVLMAMKAKESRLDPYFTAANMATICGLQIQWTTSLQDHLRLDRRQKTLRIFPYRNFMQALLLKNAKVGDSTV